MTVSGSLTLEQWWWRGRRCSGCIGELLLFVFLLSPAVQADVCAIAGLLDPSRAAAALLLLRSNQEHDAAHTNGSK